MCHADTHPLFFLTKKNLVKVFLLAVTLQTFYLCILLKEVLLASSTTLSLPSSSEITHGALSSGTLRALEIFSSGRKAGGEAIKSLQMLFRPPPVSDLSSLEASVFELQDTDTMNNYFTRLDIGGATAPVWCYTLGTDLKATVQNRTSDTCTCLQGYHGSDCGVPARIWNTGTNAQDLPKDIKRRQKPRRLIMGLTLNHELDLFEVRMALQYEIVDAFVLHESNYSNSGQPKELWFFERFRSGWLKQCQDKFVYILQASFPENGMEDAVLADEYMRRHLGQTAFNRRLGKVRPDDIFVHTEADELIHPEILAFLKLYDGYSQPVAFKYSRWAVFGFFWTVKAGTGFKGPRWLERGFNTQAMSVQLFNDLYNFDASRIQKNDFIPTNKVNTRGTERGGGPVRIFNCADDAGWRCSWCFRPEGIREKLLDTPSSYFQRHEDYSAMSGLLHLKRLIRDGMYFDLSKMRGGNGTELTLEQDPDFAPQYMIDNPDRFSYLLVNPYKNVNIIN